jgi:hypothetical protein
MSQTLKVRILLATVLALAPPLALCQDADSAPGSEKTAGAKPKDETADSRAVDASEDNYRRFMELKDDRIKRSDLPLAAYEAPTDPQRLGTLPEASQKHLRNLLREVILENGQWTPEVAKAEHPYVPSEAAVKDPQLRRREASAWDELLEKYNEREAENYARNQAARSAQQGRDKGKGEKAGGGKEGQQAASASKAAAGSEQRERRDGYAPADSDDDADSTAGVSESALEFLRRNHSGALSGATSRGEGGQRQSAASQAQSAQAASTQSAPQSAASQSQNEQAASQQASAQQNQSASQQASAQQSQSASQQASAQQSQDGDKDNDSEKSEHEKTKKTVEFEVQSKDTLSVKDLVNARGVSVPKPANETLVAPSGKDDDGQ